MKIFNKEHTLPQRDSKSINEQIPDGMWIACPICHQSIYRNELGTLKVCPECKYGFRLKARNRLALLTTNFTEINKDIMVEKTDFPGYADKLQRAKTTTQLNESVLTGIAIIDEQKVALGIMDSYFIMGSLGAKTGAKIAKLFDIATEQHLPVILFTASGGARMQEGINSLMQMAKVSAAIARHSEAGLLYISVLTDPTTGGVMASFAMQADIIVAEPHALIGFAGRRVIEQTLHEKLPADFQRAELLQTSGFLDAIIQRPELPTKLALLVRLNEVK
ncbi:acetyl-CoA carboxylase carboxyl transferase subunit beta [Weissella beninensis]|uniref:Acetyl-coenzyme A carboxylase carboxyl transferase subunit beta n=1 Tax=Periweissella beninensis TaxID=504936 RepID=A0ABT0VJC9_9LACO|nr:acetyl-CoA carboxylase carboxyltransferase subunit beta [Periweissella beninensis]MBM7543525.1 acetyl-CoA carboxylase carboxyl transferase subunit beta [Periweissella beninensis]MCM2436507.1 acetyl-CoA carboxylase carboxyl transferase subunit beta [Periweissella beninensis]